MSDAGEDYEDHESGPFCFHWNDPADCETPCFRCGHDCRTHDQYDDSCGHGGCPCVAFIDSEGQLPATNPFAGDACSMPQPVNPVPLLVQLQRGLGARLESAEHSNRKLRDQIIRATRERSALLKVIRASNTKPRTVQKALTALTKSFPKWKGWA